MPDVRVLVLSANPLARAGMEGLIRTLPGVRLVGSGAVADGASLSAQLLPDCVLLDAGSGEPEDLEPIARLATAQPGLPIVALGGNGPQTLSQALNFGAATLLPASVEQDTLQAALLASAHGLSPILRAEVAALLPAEEQVEPATDGPAESLTARELEVLQWMARGLTNRQIGLRLQISEHTVKFHAASVLGKLSARSRAEAVARAIGLGWILV